MLGWCADFFRLWWGLLYWNWRKSWFRLRRDRAPCPCQSPSDSGRAYETHCEACMLWHRPARFRRVCPLLVQTPQGLRCSAHTADVRPFWGRALGIYGGALASVYLVTVLAVFVFLRTIGYPVSILHVGLPPLWHKVGQARGWFFLDRSTRAFAAGRTAEGLLYLANSYEFDPGNYAAGLLLAKTLQAGQPAQSDKVFQQLLRDHPAKRHATAQDWYRALLARGSFERIVALAREELLADPAHGAQWVRAFVFATRQLGADAPLRELAADAAPAARPWRPLLETELLLRAGRTAEARAALERPWPADAPPFTLFYRVNAFVELRDTFAALDLLSRYPGVLDSEAALTLTLDAYAAAGSQRRGQVVDEMLAARITPANLAVVKVLCAHLIRFPDRAIFARLADKLQREALPLNSETHGIWFSLLCTAGVVGDSERLAELTAHLGHVALGPFVALKAVSAFFRGETNERRIAAYLPALPLPLEITYALHERYPPAGASVAPAAKRA